MLTIRHETASDREAIYRVEADAFAGEDEARLVDALRDAGHLLLSLVAEEDGGIVGHIAFSPMTLQPSIPPVTAAALGPIAVLPNSQRAGIGAALINEGLGQLRLSGTDCVVLLGDPGYYSRFGFVPASQKRLLRPEDPLDHVSKFLQVLELKEGVLDGVLRRIFYVDEFARSS